VGGVTVNVNRGRLVDMLVETVIFSSVTIEPSGAALPFSPTIITSSPIASV